MTPERWAVLKELFGEALDLTPAARAGFVDSVRRRDTALAHSLLNLLEYHDATLSRLDAPAMTLDRLDEIAAGATRAFRPGDIVAERFRIVRFIAEGGMGEVYAADDLELDEPVALKTIRPVLATNPAVIGSFKQEIQLARKVTHRNVSRVFDLFRHEREADAPIVFLSMELLEGETLAQRVRRVGALPPSEAGRIARQFIAGLEAAHAAGVIHRDFKCANVMLVPDARGPASQTAERVVITDFGLAGSLRQLAADARQEPLLGGTPSYMAPEQLEGGPTTAAVDIYALGVVLFEMITGRPPSEAVSESSLRGRLRSTPLSWDRAIRACLHPDPRHRASSASAVATRLNGTFYLRRASRAAAALICAGTLVAGAWYWSQRPYQPRPEALQAADAARVKRENVTGSGYVEAVTDLRRAIALDPKWPDAWADLAYTYAAGANGQQIATTIARKEARAAAVQALSLDPRSARGFGALGWVQSLDFDEWPHAEANLRNAIRREPANPYFHYWLGVHLRKQGQFSESEAETRKALALSHQRDASFWCELAFLYWTSGQLDRMRGFMNELLVAHPNFGLARYLNARLLKEEGRFEEALEELRFSERLQYSPVTVMVERASVLAYRNDARPALEILDQLTEASRTKPVDTLLIAGVYARLGDPGRAFEWLERGFAQRDSTLLSVPTSPVLKPLRTDPRFAELLRRLRFDPPQIMQRIGFNRSSAVRDVTQRIASGTSYKRPAARRFQTWRSPGTTHRAVRTMASVRP